MSERPLLHSVRSEYCIFGMRRCGQHAIARWIMRQLPGRTLFLNDLAASHSFQAILRPPERALLDRFYVDGREFPLQAVDGHAIDNLVYNHEDLPFAPSRPRRLAPGDPGFHVILVLRESFNLFASRYYFWIRMDPEAPRWQWDDDGLWADHARHFLEFQQQARPHITPILLERWQADAAYRREVANALRLQFSDAGHKDVDHIGSSFDLHRFNGQADRMAISRRWEQLLDIPAYTQILTRPRIHELNKLVSPDHPIYRQLERTPMNPQRPSVQSINHCLTAGDLGNARKLAIQLCHAEPGNLEAWYCLAAISARAGALDDVVSSCRRMLAIAPGNPAALYNLGTALTALQRHAEALAVYGELIAQQPGNTAALANMAAAYRALGQTGNALATAARALALDANMHPARNILGLAYLDAGKTAEAEQCFRELVRLMPNADSAQHNLGLALLARNDYAGAVAALREATRLNSANADASVDLAQALSKNGDKTAALDIARRTATQFPNHAGAQNSLGIRLTEHGELDAAHACFERAHALAPRAPDILCHLGNSLLFGNDVTAALACFEDALRIQPDHAQAHWQRAWCLLLLGDLAEGWKEYEWRFQAGIAAMPGYPQPQWQGEDLSGRRVLLFGEQGFGDSLQFVRYATLVKQRGAQQVIVQCRTELKAVFATCPGVDAVIDDTDPLPAFDLQAPLLSLPRLCGTTLDTIPARTPYLSAPADRTPPPALTDRAQGRLKVGITWSGNPQFRWNRLRSCTLADFAPLARRQDLQLFSLQKGDSADELRSHPDFSSATDLGGDFRDFADTAAAMQALDLIITTDTSVAHLAGALGRETWLLLSYAADWRWLLERSDSPWYPSLRLFRQPAPGDWATPMRAILQALDQRAGS